MSRRAILPFVTSVVLACVFIVLTAPISLCQYVLSPPLRVEPDTLAQYTPSLAMDSLGNPCLVWQDEFNRTHFARSTDGGQSFAPSVVVLDSFSWLPVLALDSRNNPHVTWTCGMRAIYTRSTDGGETFLPAIQVASDSFRCLWRTRLATDKDNNPMVVWYGEYMGRVQAVFARSRDGGMSFDSPVTVDSHGGHQKAPEIAVDDEGIIHICYLGDTQFGSPYLFATRSTDGGAIFSERVCVDRNSASNGLSSIAVVPASGNPWTGQGDVMIAWAEDRFPGSPTGIYFSRSTNGGSSFWDVVPVSESRYDGGVPVVASDICGSPVVAWVEDDKVTYAYSLDGGSSFLPSSPVDPETLGRRDQPDIAIDRSGTLMIAWSDIRSPHFPTWQIYFTSGRRVTGADEERPAPDRDPGFSLRENSPNPFARSTVIPYRLCAEGHATLNVYGTSGRLVRTLVDQKLPAGWHSAPWDGTDSEGLRVSAGVYFCKLCSGEFSATGKMVLLR